MCCPLHPGARAPPVSDHALPALPAAELLEHSARSQTALLAVVLLAACMIISDGAAGAGQGQGGLTSAFDAWKPTLLVPCDQGLASKQQTQLISTPQNPTLRTCVSLPCRRADPRHLSGVGH